MGIVVSTPRMVAEKQAGNITTHLPACRVES